jgi:hypothetical protein
MIGKKKITLILSFGNSLEFVGWHRPDLERPNWHYYEDENGSIIHCRKEHMVCVKEKDV